MASETQGKSVKITDEGIKALEQLVAQTQAENNLPGFAIAITNNDEQLFAAAGGHKVYRDPSSGQVTPDHLFWICSLTKLITSIAALQLIEQGKLSVDDPVSKYIPQFKNVVVLEGDYFSKERRPYRPAKEVITVAHLFNHSSGLGYYTRMPDNLYSAPDCASIEHGPTREATTEKFLELLQEGYPGIPVSFEPGTGWTYGFNHDILGIIVERITGQGLNEYCKEHIFDPVGMKSTTWMLTEESYQKLVGLTIRNADGSISPWNNHAKLYARYPQKVNLSWGGVGAYSTLPDYAALLRHILAIHAGKEVEKPVLKASTVQTLFLPSLGEAGSAAMDAVLGFLDPTITIKGSNWSNAFALTTQDLPGRRKAGTGFWSGWAGLLYTVDPTTGIAIVTGSQVVPTMDRQAVALFNRVEEVVYANLA
ncbi:hypothetical protein NMY22_g13305 [Coprinellus aureogranulatus]|nr:hypothetical protein NMY22_g13305 [Coprinellus aureogranulatus]